MKIGSEKEQENAVNGTKKNGKKGSEIQEMMQSSRETFAGTYVRFDEQFFDWKS